MANIKRGVSLTPYYQFNCKRCSVIGHVESQAYVGDKLPCPSCGFVNTVFSRSDFHQRKSGKRVTHKVYTTVTKWEKNRLNKS